jgi:DsbC/DsbD-like thiol-disulfide interchange protein
MGRLVAICACLLVLLLGCVRSAPPQAVHSKASMVIEQWAVAPGSTVNAGIEIVTDRGWHIYWRNPGDSGEPPRMQWQLPSGITAGELEWPTPRRMTTSAGTDFGYQGTTVLLSTLQVPTTLPSGTITVGGDLRWLVCHDICIPQSAHLEAPIQIAGTDSIDDSARRLLRSAAERLPATLPASSQPEVANLPDSFRVTLVPSETITRAEFFPSEESQIDNGAAQELTYDAGKVSLTLKKSEYLRQEPQHLRGVLVLNGGDAYLFDAPVQGPATQRLAIQTAATREGNRQK